MAKIADQIENTLKSNDWNYERHYNDEDKYDVFIFGIRGENVHIRVHIIVDEEMERYMVRCFPDWYVPKNLREEAMKILNKLNGARWLTRGSIDPEDGELVFVSTVICSGVKLSDKSIDLIINTNIGVTDDETMEIMKGVFGNDNSSASPASSPEPTLPWTPRSDN